MIELAFQPDRAAIQEDLSHTSAETHPAVLETTCFVTQVRMSSEQGELVAYPGVHPDWRPLPLLGFATILRDAVAHVGESGRSQVSLADGGLLVIEREGPMAKISPSLLEQRVAVVPYEDLRQLTSDFARNACAYLVAEVPWLRDHEAWPRWTRVPA